MAALQGKLSLAHIHQPSTSLEGPQVLYNVSQVFGITQPIAELILLHWLWWLLLNPVYHLTGLKKSGSWHSEHMTIKSNNSIK